MITSKYFLYCFALLLLSSSVNAELIFTESFENESNEGESPYKATVIRPKKNTPGLSCVIVGEAQNLAGVGKGIFLQDRLAETNATVALEYDFVDSISEQISALRIDFNFSRAGNKTTKKDTLYFGAGEYFGSDSLKMNSKSRRYLQVDFLTSDAVKFNSDSGKDRTTSIEPLSPNTLTIFVNDYDSKSIEYEHPATSESTILAANTVVYYLNGRFAHETKLDLDDLTVSGTVASSENNFGRIGFYSQSKSDNNAWIFDHLRITKL